MFNHSQINVTDSEIYLKALIYNSSLLHFNLFITIDDSNVQQLADSLKHNSSLRQLYLHINHLTDTSLSCLDNALWFNNGIITNNLKGLRLELSRRVDKRGYDVSKGTGNF